MYAANLVVFGLGLINQICQLVCYMLNISMLKTQREEDLISAAALTISQVQLGRYTVVTKHSSANKRNFTSIKLLGGPIPLVSPSPPTNIGAPLIIAFVMFYCPLLSILLRAIKLSFLLCIVLKVVAFYLLCCFLPILNVLEIFSFDYIVEYSLFCHWKLFGLNLGSGRCKGNSFFL